MEARNGPRPRILNECFPGGSTQITVRPTGRSYSWVLARPETEHSQPRSWTEDPWSPSVEIKNDAHATISIPQFCISNLQLNTPPRSQYASWRSIQCTASFTHLEQSPQSWQS